MLLSNFRVKKDCGYRVVAEVDVRDWSTLWLIPKTRTVVSGPGFYFTFEDTGRGTPGFECEKLFMLWAEGRRASGGLNEASN